MHGPPPPGFKELQQTELGRVFGRVVGVRMLLMPVLGVAALGLALYEDAVWRQVLLVVFVVAAVGISAFELWRYSRRGMAPGSIPFNVGVGVVGHTTLCAATGGLESPLLPLMPIIALFAGIWAERPAVRHLMVGAQVAALWVFAAVATSGAVPSFNLSLFGGGARAGHGDALLYTTALVMTLVLVAAAGVGKGMRSVFSGMLLHAFEAREESLRSHAERASELTALSAEIAHELKNPLASVKGLSALLARDLTEGKPAERLGVLRRELDRMQATLDEFLNFSRPLVPLSLESAELGRLAEEVSALHEGMARERKVSIEVRGAASARCDPRKVRQVLLNLVQNGIDASPPGRALEIELLEQGDRAIVRVLDRGEGIDEGLGERIFEPGITTKARGSGLGLTIARALARQHRGELTLTNREGGGCVAELRLPRAGEAAETAAEGVSA